MRLSRRQQLLKLARAGLGKLIGLILRLEARLCRLLGEVRALPPPSQGTQSAAGPQQLQQQSAPLD